jgi:hypothetical protein
MTKVKRLKKDHLSTWYYKLDRGKKIRPNHNSWLWKYDKGRTEII